MKTFLMVVGGIVVGGILLLVIGGLIISFYLRSKLGSLKNLLEKFADQVKFAAAVPPFRVTLHPVATGEWSNLKVAEMSGALESRGFVSAGDFRVEPIPAGLHLRLLANESQGVYAAVYEHGQAGIWVDLVTAYRDGRVHTTASLKDHLMDSMPNKTIRFHEGAEAGWLLDEHLSKRPVGDWLRVKADELPDRFVTKYAEEMEWRGMRGGPTEDEIRRVSARDGNEATPEIVHAIRDAWQSAFHAHRAEELKSQFRGMRVLPEEEETSETEWLIVYDGMPVSLVGDAVESLRYVFDMESENEDAEDSDSDEDRETRAAQHLADQVAQNGARSAFAEATRAYLGRQGFDKRGTIASPLAADLYHLPESDGEDDDLGEHGDDD